MTEINHVLIVEDVKATADWLLARVQSAFGSGTSVCQAHTLASARRLLLRQGLDMAIVDIGLPDGSGIELIRELKATGRNIVVVVATIYDDDAHIFSALRAGADGYLLKDHGDEDTERALSGIRDGRPPISPGVARRMMEFFVQHARHEPEMEEVRLTAREQEVLIMIANGLSVVEAAANLGISVHTARGYVKEIYRKLGISSRAEASLRASRMGLIRR